MTMEELVGSLITYEHTLQIDKEEIENNKKKKKDLALMILMQGERDNFVEKMAFVTKNFQRFLRNKVGASTSRRQ